MCLNIGTPKNINFSFETNGKLMALGVPILKHIRIILPFLARLYECTRRAIATPPAAALAVATLAFAKC